MQWIRVKHPPPHDGHDWVQIIVRIRDNTTGEVRDYPTETTLEPGEEVPNTYLWDEGNYGCDCNRGLFFQYAAAGAQDPEDTPCGDERFSVQILNPVDGQVIYDEFADECDAA